MTNDPKLNAVRLVNDFSFAMLEEYIRQLPEKGEDWKTMERSILKQRLVTCLGLFEDALCAISKSSNQALINTRLMDARDELRDLAILAMLLWYRLGEEEK